MFILRALAAPEPPAKTPRTALGHRLIWAAVACGTFGIATLALRALNEPVEAPPLVFSTASAPPSVDPGLEQSTAQTRKLRSMGFGDALLNDAIDDLAKSLGHSAPSSAWSAALQLRAFGARASSEAQVAAQKMQQAPDHSGFGDAPTLFAAAPRLALASSLLEAELPIAAESLSAVLAERQSSVSAAPGAASTSELALALELESLLALRQPERAALVALARDGELAHAKLDRSLRTPEPLSWESWQLAAALMHAPPERDSERQANLRRLWGRLGQSPLPTELLSQALRVEALASGIKSGLVTGAEAVQLLRPELDHLRYLVNTEAFADDLAREQGRTFALRALRLGRSALATDTTAAP